MAAGVGATIGSPFLSSPLLAAPGSVGGTQPKRIIFFMQNQGFHPDTCLPTGLGMSGSLAKVKLPEPISPLEPFKDRLHILTGLHGTHTSPSHSAFFGAWVVIVEATVFRPSASTIDYEMSRTLPQTMLPHLCIGMDSIENMQTKPTLATLSASGAGQPIFMHSNPNHLYQMLYGGISTGDIRKHHEARSTVMDQIEKLAAAKGQSLPNADQQRYRQYVQGFEDSNGLRDRLDTVADHLRQFAPEVDEGYTQPEFETDWARPSAGSRHFVAQVRHHEYADDWFGPWRNLRSVERPRNHRTGPQSRAHGSA